MKARLKYFNMIQRPLFARLKINPANLLSGDRVDGFISVDPT
jgi:hypothetical protein